MTDHGKTAPDEVPEDLQRTIDELEGSGRVLGPRLSVVVAVIAALWSVFQLWIASPLPFLFDFAIITGVPARGVHLAFGMLLCFVIFPATRRGATDRLPWYDLALAIVAALAALYLFLGWDGLVARQGVLMSYDLGGDFVLPVEAIIGGIGIVLLLEATRRSIGIPLVVVCLVFIAFSIFGQVMPDLISHKGVSLNRLIGYQWLGGEAIFGIPIDVSVSFVFLFVLFGALLDRAGAGQYFLDLAFAMVGRYSGGPAKAAILASGMTGMISGSSIANVVTTGTFTIPVMKRIGLPAVKAGAIEVAASTNGQIMPPIMGAAAFIIAEFVGISYFDVVVAAAIPAVLSYVALLYISHLEAQKLNLRGLPRAEIPLFVATFLSGVHFMIPIVVLVYLLMVERWTASSAVFYSIIWMMLIILGGRAFPGKYPRSYLVVPLSIPVLLSTFLRWVVGMDATPATVWGLALAVAIIAAMVLLAISQDRGSALADIKSGFQEIGAGLVAGARNMVGIAVAVAAAGIIVGAVSSTGLGNTMVGVVEAISGGNVFVLLVLTAGLCLILGMGLPTTANYVVVALLLSNVVVELGNAAGLELPLIGVHLFVFYFGLLADSTPPVCLAAFAASAISRANPLKTGLQSFAYDMRTALLPFIFLFNPQLLLIGVDSIWEGLLVVFVSLVAILCFSAATQRWLLVKVRWHEVVLLLLAAFILFRPGFFMDRLFPPFAAIELDQFVAGEVAVEPGNKLRPHVVRETAYGDRFKLFVLEAPSPDPAARKGPFGATLEREPDGRYLVADLAANGLAEQAGLDFGDYVTDVEIEQPDQPPKELVYPVGLLVVLLVLLLQYMRRRSDTGRPAGALAQ